MPAFETPCPQCGRMLRLPDRAQVGRKVRCAKCGHKFILKEPDEVLPRQREAPQVQVEFASLDDDGELQERPHVKSAAGTLPEPSETAAHPAPSAAAESLQSAGDSVVIAFQSLAQDTEAELAARVRKRKLAARRQRRWIAGGLVVLLAGGIGTYFALTKSNTKAIPRADAAPRVETTAEPEEVVDATDTAGAADESKQVDPITLQLVPEGARIVVHLRPAELWQPGGSAEEFRACLGPVGIWLEKVIKARCLLEPAQIEEALFALIPISRDEFDVAVVVRSKQPLKKSELIEKFQGDLVNRPQPHYVGKDRAWFVRDTRTFAGAPKAMAASMVEAAEGSVSSDGVLALLPRTSRKKQITIVCELEDVRLGARNLAPENAQDLLEGIVDFFGDDVETIAWGLQLGEDENKGKLASEILVRNRLSRAVPKLEADLKKKLAQLPKEILDLVYRTYPKTIGERKIVGRFPIMVKVVERLTHFERAPRLVAMHVELPERAGPNLAVASLLTWDQTTRPGFGKSSSAPSAAPDKAKLPDKIAERLQKKISVEFRREFFYSAIDYIGGEIGVKFVLDGPGMKDVGTTQNEYQTLTMENVPATAVLDQMLTAKKLVLIVDEEKKTATVTSLAGAERMKRKPFPLTGK